jgi:hypothetical protein
MLNLDPELIRLLHRERHERLVRAARQESASVQRRPARPAPRLRIAPRLRRPEIRLREDV